MAGHYYNPPSPHVGGRQPLEPPRVIPASGPTPTPPPTTGALIAQAILDAWRPPPPGPYLADGPYGNELIVPPISGPAPTNPPFMGGSRVRSEILAAWLPPAPGPYFDMEQPYAPAVMPPQLAVARVPLGARIGQDILDSWLPGASGPYLAEQPYALELTVPPISGSAAQNPPFMGGARLSREVLNAWIPPAPQPLVAVLLDPPISGQTPQNPPFIGGAQIRSEILIAWLPAAPGPYMSAQPYNDVTVSPPQSADRPIIGASIAEAILVSWQLPGPAWQLLQTYAVQQQPAASYIPPPLRMLPLWPLPDPLPTLPTYAEQPAPVPQFAQLIGWSWSEPESYPPIVTTPAPASGPAPTAPPLKGTRVPDGVLQAWTVPPAAPISSELSTPPSGAAPPYVPPARVMQTWPAPEPAAQSARDIVPPISGQTPQNPPFTGGASVPEAVSISWLPPAPPPPTTQPGVKQGVAPSAPPLGGGVPAAVLASWQTVIPAWQPVSYTVQQPVAASYVPPAARIMPSWGPPDPAFQSSTDVDPPRSGPTPGNPPIVGGSPALQAIYATWNVPLPQAVVTNAHLVLGTIILIANPEYIVSYGRVPRRLLGYPASTRFKPPVGAPLGGFVLGQDRLGPLSPIVDGRHVGYPHVPSRKNPRKLD